MVIWWPILPFGFGLLELARAVAAPDLPVQAIATVRPWVILKHADQQGCSSAVYFFDPKTYNLLMTELTIPIHARGDFISTA